MKVENVALGLAMAAVVFHPNLLAAPGPAAPAAAPAALDTAKAPAAGHPGMAVKLDAEKRWFVYKQGFKAGVPSNWMPKEAASFVKAGEITDSGAGKLFQIRVGKYVDPFWWGISVASADGYWGLAPGSAFNLKGAKKLVCLIKGTGRVQLKMGITHAEGKPYTDSTIFPPQTEYFTLNPKEYEPKVIEFSADDDLTRIISPFVIVSSRDQQEDAATPVVVFIKEIYYQF